MRRRGADDRVQASRPLDAAAYRRLMRSWASGVAVVASCAGGRLEGCTVSAFTSVAVTPPMVLVCLDERGRTCAAVMAAGRFSVNILGSGQAWLAEQFAEKGAEDHFRGICHRLELGVPVLADVVCYLVCEVDEVLRGADHAVFLGAPVGGGAAGGGEPLVYVDRTYRRPGEPVHGTRPTPRLPLEPLAAEVGGVRTPWS